MSGKNDLVAATVAGGVAASQALVPAQPVGGMLMEPTDADLTQWVADELAKATRNGERFTAYEIAMRLRPQHPGIMIRHWDRGGQGKLTVQALVHDAMTGPLGQGYTREIAGEIQGQPWRYLPVPQLTVTVPAITAVADPDAEEAEIVADPQPAAPKALPPAGGGTPTIEF